MVQLTKNLSESYAVTVLSVFTDHFFAQLPTICTCSTHFASKHESAWSRNLIVSKLWVLVSTGINVERERTVQQNVKNKQWNKELKSDSIQQKWHRIILNALLLIYYLILYFMNIDNLFSLQFSKVFNIIRFSYNLQRFSIKILCWSESVVSTKKWKIK